MVYINLTKIVTKVNIHESKTIVKMCLSSLLIEDTLYNYKYEKLKKFLYCKQSSLDESLIDIDVEQIAKNHPKYENVNTSVNFCFGKLTCNYKC
jgi:hypothetical protein